ncbi:tRNA preQ1(34) S-adenosylmethionine ribosyltransferase-isomerase QueA [bacterium]|nr:tRNA preQ1(34) S-adenosylmethionine ribosyltransferase-isomerase QueA [bacterium]
MLLSEFDYELPEELIAQRPADERTHSRMMVLNRENKTIENKHFFDIIDYLTPNDVLVLNDTKVIPARLYGHKVNEEIRDEKSAEGAKIEVFLLKDKGDGVWEALLKPSKRIKPNQVIRISDDLQVVATEFVDDGKWLIKMNYDGNIYDILSKIGNVPLPPYIERKMTNDELKKLDYDRYQTVYAHHEGSVAAPTAGLHFSEDIMNKLRAKGVQICYVNLSVGLGTFRPVKCDDVTSHKMDSETFEISEETAKIIDEAKANGKNIVAVGTTSVRTLETAFAQFGKIQACKSESRLFIYPPYKFNVVDKLITNFHLPKSTLIMLVSAFAGKDYIFNAYSEAVKEKYRFYSYGDCMFIQ